jgi:hypothetical protein
LDTVRAEARTVLDKLRAARTGPAHDGAGLMTDACARAIQLDVEHVRLAHRIGSLAASGDARAHEELRRLSVLLESVGQESACLRSSIERHRGTLSIEPGRPLMRDS